MKPPVSAYLIKKDEILFKSYRLLCLFFANKQISNIAHPEDSKEPLKKLESRFLFSQASTLLLEVAILFRALDEQIRKFPDSATRGQYVQRLEQTNQKYGPMMFEEHIDIRECCNKIIHAKTFEPHLVEGDAPHSKDYPAFYGDSEQELQWHHLSGNVRITGEHKGQEWAFLIQIPEFVEAIAFLLDDS